MKFADGIKFAMVMRKAAQLCGIDPYTLASTDFRMIRDYAAHRLQMVTRRFPWPGLVSVESLTFSSGSYSFSKPLSAETVLQITTEDPRTVACPAEWAFTVEPGIGDTAALVVRLLDSTHSGALYVTYKKQFPEIWGDVFSATKVYSAGDQIYFQPNSTDYLNVETSMDGAFYDCASTTTAGQSPTTHSSKWTVTEVPGFLGEYLPRAILADFLRSERQFEMANAAEADAEAVLEMEFDRLIRQQGTQQKLNVQFTY